MDYCPSQTPLSLLAGHRGVKLAQEQTEWPCVHDVVEEVDFDDLLLVEAIWNNPVAHALNIVERVRTWIGLGIFQSISNSKEEFSIFTLGNDTVTVEIDSVESIFDCSPAFCVGHISVSWDGVLDIRVGTDVSTSDITVWSKINRVVASDQWTELVSEPESSGHHCREDNVGIACGNGVIEKVNGN